MIAWKTEKRKISELKDYDKNPRRFTEKGLADLKASLENLGYIDPIAINQDGTIIGGHARKKTLKALGLKEIDVRVPDRLLSDKEVQQAIIRLNKNIAGEFDFDLLTNNFDVDDLINWGFESEDFGIKSIEGLTDPNEVQEVQDDPISILGDMWLLGSHKLRCGDSTKADDVNALLGSINPHLMVTDPPYGVNYDASWREGHDLNIGKKIGGKFSPRATGKVNNDDKADWMEVWSLFPGNIAYVWHGGLHAAIVQKNLEDAGFTIRAQIIWVKQHFVFGRGDYHWQHEPCWYAVKDTGNWKGDRKQTTIWNISNNNPFGTGGKAEKKEGHSTQKPVECMKRPIENNSSPGQAIYEPFSGSGTTIIAGEMTGRHVYAMEISPEYVDMAVIRWQNFTGKLAVHAETGKSFNELKDAKKAA